MCAKQPWRTSIHRPMCQTVSRMLLPRSSARHSTASSSRSLTRRRSPAPMSSNHFAMSSVSRMGRVYGVAMADDRRRPLREEELTRIARAIDPRARATHSAPLLGGLDAATYALDLDVAGERRELVVRVFTMPEHRDGAVPCTRCRSGTWSRSCTFRWLSDWVVGYREV